MNALRAFPTSSPRLGGDADHQSSLAGSPAPASLDGRPRSVPPLRAMANGTSRRSGCRPLPRGARRAIAALLFSALSAGAVFADGSGGQKADQGILQRSSLFGDLWGLRPWLVSHGVTVAATEYAVPSAVVVGGVKEGVAFAGLLAPSISLDFGRIAGLPGLTAYLSAWVPQGQGPSTSLVGSFSPMAFIEAPLGVKLADAYLSWQSPGGLFYVKVGKFGLDETFDQNPAAATLLDSNYTYRDIWSYDLPGGGVAFPFEAAGAMFTLQPTPWLELLAGAFSGDPAGLPVTATAESLDPNGLALPFDAGVLTIGEVDLTYNPPMGPGKLLFGGMYDSLPLPDLQNPSLSDTNEYLLYAAANQTLWQDTKAGRALVVFARTAYAPPDQNIIVFDLQGGITLNGPFASRPSDSVALAASYDETSSHNTLGLTSESDLELAYGLQLVPWLKLTPDLQYVLQPGGEATTPNALVVELMGTASL